MRKLVLNSTMKVVSKLVNRKQFCECHFALQATKFVVWDVVAIRPCSDCAGSQNGSVSATM
jgi:hypothetical protein